MKNLLLLICIVSFGKLVQCQNTVGVLNEFDNSLIQEGYNLMYPHNQSTTYLLNNCGEVVHTWEDEFEFRPGNTVYLQENGDLIRCKRSSTIAGDVIWAGGGGAYIERIDWDGNLIWSYFKNDDEGRLHHDISVMPNGNVLAIEWVRLDSITAVENGRDPNLLTDGEIWSERVIELEYDGVSDVNIVWEWHVWDHLVQDFDDTAPNFGDVSTSPERINLNYDTEDGAKDWLHANALDYNQFSDLIMLSIPTFNEIWIIDHSTSTAQAASSSGGNSGIGGDLMYRWGNPAAYNQGNETSQKLFYQHDAHWVDLGLNGAHPHFGKIAIFNNRLTSETSSAHLINPTFVTYEWGFPMNGDTWGPEDYEWSLEIEDQTDMYSNILSSIQFLPNENVLVTVGRPGYVFEATEAGEILWEYKNPMIAGNVVDQGVTPDLSANLLWRMYRYPSDYSGFEGADLSPQGNLETNPILLNVCNVDNIAESSNTPFNLYPNPAKSEVTVIGLDTEMHRVKIINQLGQTVEEFAKYGSTFSLDLNRLEKGIYLINIDNVSTKRLVVYH